MHGSVGKYQKRGVAVTQNVTTGSGGMLEGQNRVGWRGKIAHYAQDAKGASLEDVGGGLQHMGTTLGHPKRTTLR